MSEKSHFFAEFRDEIYNRNTTTRKTITFVKRESNLFVDEKKYNFALKLDAATLAGACVYVYGQRWNFLFPNWNRIFQISPLIWTSKIPKMKLQKKNLKKDRWGAREDYWRPEECKYVSLYKICSTYLASLTWTKRVWEETRWSFHEARCRPNPGTFLLGQHSYCKGGRLRTVFTENHSKRSWRVFARKRFNILHHPRQSFLQSQQSARCQSQVSELGER